ncbi:MAG: 3-hydroxyacyl-CoA dehydrogenase family protein [Candidatus Binataceae bacterium]
MGAGKFQAVILGANGTMGSGAAAIFAGAGWQVVLLARQRDKAAQGLRDAQNFARAEAVAERVTVGDYQHDLASAVAEADLVFESLAEDLALKCDFLARVDTYRRADSMVATGSSGLSIAEMARGRSDSFRRNFLGIHLFNPPHVIVGTEVIPNPETDRAVLGRAIDMLRSRLGRRVIVTKDRPAFVGNRVGFKVLNETAQLAHQHGVAFIDYLIGPHTGRAMPPLQTVDLVGWDVHKAIVDNVHENCEDEAHACFKLPPFMEMGFAQGRLGDKTPALGGFYRKNGKANEVLDPKSGAYIPMQRPAPIEFVERMKALNHVGRYADAMSVLAEASGAEAELCRRVVLGYVSYALNRVGEVAESAADVDTIMSYGFNWAPPCAIVDLIGSRRTAELLARHQLPVPASVEQAARGDGKMCAGGALKFARTFIG